MSARRLSSAFAAEIEAYVDFKASVGVAGKSLRWHLGDFDRWCAERGRRDFDRDTVEGWVAWRRERTSPDHLGWMSYVRGLGEWMRANGHPDAYVLSRDFRARSARVAPFLMSQEEVEAFFSAAASYAPPSPMAWEARCVFALMHSCGLRTCEARRLGRGDVDTDARTIDVRWSKGHRSRRLPVTAEVADMLARCRDATDREVGRDRAAFFATSTGRGLSSSCVCEAFHRIWSAAGLPERRAGRRPRPYDFRHRFAYANIERWGREGRDAMAMLPYLQRYMGHATIESTYYYVHTSPDFLAGFAGAVSPLDSILPEVGFDG